MKQDLAALRVARPDGVGPSLGLLLTRSGHAVRASLQPVLDEEGLLFEQWLVLSVLADAPGLRMSEIADASVVPAASLTRHMDKLVERALVVRRIDAEDKRRAVCALSARGQDLVDRIRTVETAIEHTLIKAFGEDHYRQVIKHLELTTEALKERA